MPVAVLQTDTNPPFLHGLVYPATERQRLGEVKRVHEEAALRSRQPVVPSVAKQEAGRRILQIMSDPVDRRLHALIFVRQEAEDPDEEVRGIDLIRLVVLYKGLVLLVPPVGQDVRVAAASAPREPATDSVPGRPLVDLSFLSDIVPAAESGGTTSADGGAPVPAEATRTTAPAPTDASGPTGAPATATAEPEPAVAPPSASEPSPAAHSNGHQSSSVPSPPTAAAVASAGGAASRGQPTTTGPAAEPVVDFDFLANAGEYVGGGEREAGMKEFLQFLAQG